MAVSFQTGAASESHTGTAGSISEASFSWAHTPVGTSRGVLVFVISALSATGKAISVTYDGVSVPEIAAAKASTATAEAGTCQTFFLGSGVPTTDPPTVVVNRTNDVTEVFAICATVDALTDTEVHEPGIVLVEGITTVIQKSVDDGSPGTDSLRFAAGFFGHTSPPGPGADSNQMHGIDMGAFGASGARELVAGQGSRSVGFSSGSDDNAAVHLAVREVAAGGPTTYEKTGVVTASMLEAGVDVSAFSETGAFLTAGRAAAVDVATYAEAGALTASGLLAGASEEEAGGKSGALAAGGQLRGADAAEHPRAGVLAGGSRISGADVYTAAETGALIAGALLAGADVVTRARTGSLIAQALLAGADALVDVKTGSVTTASLLAGTGLKEGAGKAGSLLASTTLAGPDSVERTKFGALLTATVAAGPDVFTAVEAGSLIASALAAGVDVFIAEETGSLLSATFLAGVTDSAPPVVIFFDRPTPVGGLDVGTPGGGHFDQPTPNQIPV